MTPRYEAILFDFDGVLVDSEPEHYACWCEILTRFGIALDWPTYHAQFIGASDRAMIRAMAELAVPPVAFDDIWCLYPEKKRLFRERMDRAIPFAHGILDFLPTLAGYRLGVVTSSGRAEVEPVLERGGIRALFEAAIFGEDVIHHKPAPDPYRRAAEQLGITRALVVEDSAAGIAAGRAAGFDVVEIPEPAHVVEMVREWLCRTGL
jgi:beta-phosphoglucomutase